MSYDQNKAANFAKRLKGILRDRNLTQVEVQRDTGLSQQAISGWCRGLHLPRGERLSVLSAYLQMTPRELCPEAFDDNTVKMTTSSISFGPIDDQDGWYMLKISPGMAVDQEFVEGLMRLNREFVARKKAEGFKDVEW